MNAGAVEHFDAVVVGSGFGGSVMTHRLRDAGKSVCLLERGQPFPPGSFPRSPHAFRRAFWDPSRGLYGMYNIWAFRNFGAVVSSGLGGGSLIYANVLLRKDPSGFVREPGVETWPITREELDPHYDRAEVMLGAQQYPIDHSPYTETARTAVFMQTAREMGWDPFTPNLAVSFSNPGEAPVPGVPLKETVPNLHGRPRTTCQLVGECDIGCNVGAKNTLDLTLLSVAQAAGADIRTLCEVRSFTPRPGGGWTVRYVRHDPANEPSESRTPALETVTADRLVLSAGTLGSTFLMLRNLPGVNPLLGHRFSGNGDLLTMAVGAKTRRAGRDVPTLIDAGRGPTITAAVRFPDARDGASGPGWYLEDVGYPEFLNWLLEAAESPRALWRFRHTLVRLILAALRRDPETDISADIAELLGTTELSSSVMPLAGMGRDTPDGVLKLRGERLDADWSIDGSTPYFKRVRDTMQAFAQAMGARFEDNPLWHLGRRVITVHPLGGCPMGRDPSEGVVDSYGQVFGQQGLVIADGSVMPGPVGPNPSLTITALADRFADHLLASMEVPTSQS